MYTLGNTKNYSKFRFLFSNRELDYAHVKNLEKSILSKGLINPIIVDNNFNIIDGQHRFIALEKNKLPIHYLINKEATDSSILDVNNVKKGWTALNYINYHLDKGNINYFHLNERIESLGSELAVASILEIYTKTHSNKYLREGKYDFDKDLGDMLLKYIRIIGEKFDRAFEYRFVKSLKMIVLRNSNFDINRLINKVEHKRLYCYNNYAETAESIVDVYNYKLKSKKFRIS